MSEDLKDAGGVVPPGGLSANASSGGLNRIEFHGGTEPGVQYEVWRRHGDTVDWYLHATTSEPGFSDEGVEAGQYYEYKVRAVRGDSMSEFSPSAVVYGVE